MKSSEGPLINVALGKSATQSSDAGYRCPSKTSGHTATSGIKKGGFGFHTHPDPEPWWLLDLESAYEIHRIIVYNRESANPDNARTLTISLGLKPDGPWTEVHKSDASFGGFVSNSPLDVKLKKGISARYVRLHLRESKHFHLDEVEVYGLAKSQEAKRLAKAYKLRTRKLEAGEEEGSDLVNSDAWNRAAFCAEYNVDRGRLMSQWFHGMPTIDIDRSIPFNGKIETLRLHGNGGLGNVIFEMINASILARSMKCSVIEVAGKGVASDDLPLTVDGLLISPHRPPETKRPALDGCFYWPGGANAIVGDYTADFALDTIRRFVSPAFSRYIKAAPPGADDVLTIHFRAGDIFAPGPMPYGGYIQPPVSYYFRAIKFAKENFGVRSVHLVFQDRTNPCVDMVSEYLSDQHIAFTSQSSTLFEDVVTLMGARNLVAGYGSFCEAVALLSPHVKTYTGFRAVSTQSNIAFWAQSRTEDILRAKGVRTFVIDDQDGNYIKPYTWNNSPEQLNLMKTYPESQLRLQERLGS